MCGFLKHSLKKSGVFLLVLLLARTFKKNAQKRWTLWSFDFDGSRFNLMNLNCNLGTLIGIKFKTLNMLKIIGIGLLLILVGFLLILVMFKNPETQLVSTKLKGYGAGIGFIILGVFF
jgi:hypothetical protein